VTCNRVRITLSKGILKREIVMSIIRSKILSDIETWCLAMSVSHDAFGRRSVGDNKLLIRLRRGEGTTLTRIEEVYAYMTSERQRRLAISEAA